MILSERIWYSKYHKYICILYMQLPILILHVYNINSININHNAIEYIHNNCGSYTYVCIYTHNFAYSIIFIIHCYICTWLCIILIALLTDIRMYASKHRSTNTNIPVIIYVASNDFGVDVPITKLSPLVVIIMIRIFNIIMQFLFNNLSL